MHIARNFTNVITVQMPNCKISINLKTFRNFLKSYKGLGLGLDLSPRPRAFLQGQGQALHYQGQDLAIRDQGQGQDLQMESSRILEAKARPRRQQNKTDSCNKTVVIFPATP